MQSLNARGYSAFALDMRGYGKTPRDATGWLTPDRAARDLIATLEWLAREKKIQRPVLLGWSFGSLISQLAAQRRPDLISALILYGYPRDPANPAAAAPEPPEPAREVNTRERATSDFISPKVTPQKVIDTYVAAALAADPVRVDWHNQSQFSELDPAKVVTPTLVLQGERDPLAPADAQSRLFTRLGTADRQWVVLPGADHAALVEDVHPAFIAAILAFVSRPGK
jgi:pimeloyl-ACP methyl ester carboxylesterase